jgi:branched-chain amino acid transport system substrate-binding protein
LANRDGLVQMDVSANAPSYSTPDDYTYRTGVVATDLVTALADMLDKRFHVSEIAVLFIENAQGYEMVSAFEKVFRGKVKAAVSYKAGGPDYGAELLRIRSHNISDIFLIGHLEEAGLIVRRASQMGIKARFFSTVYAVEGVEFLQTAKETADGIWYVAPHFAPEIEGTAAGRFAARYKDKFHEMPNYFAAQAYDGTYALGLAMRQCLPLTRACLRVQLQTLDTEGALGRIKFDRNGDVAKEIVLKTIKNGAFVEVP